MKSFPFLVGLCALSLLFAGCGPLQSPLPARLDADQQKAIDDAWDNAVRPVNHYDHQGLLDALLITRGYESGIDKMTLRSEKQLAVGKVVMEVHYDRLVPADDRFEVQILDGAGKLLRKERYGREEVEKTYEELFVKVEELRGKRSQGNLPPDQGRQLAQIEARMKAVEEVFPKQDLERKEKGKPGQ
jgi:hypothetical protein